jgi:hypothetical protein
MLQVAGPLRPLWALHPLLTELSECDLCLGFWVYLGLALFLPGIFGLFPWLVEVVILAMLSSLMAHLIRLGWLSKFGCEVVG